MREGLSDRGVRDVRGCGALGRGTPALDCRAPGAGRRVPVAVSCSMTLLRVAVPCPCSGSRFRVPAPRRCNPVAGRHIPVAGWCFAPGRCPVAGWCFASGRWRVPGRCFASGWCSVAGWCFASGRLPVPGRCFASGRCSALGRRSGVGGCSGVGGSVPWAAVEGEGEGEDSPGRAGPAAEAEAEARLGAAGPEPPGVEATDRCCPRCAVPSALRPQLVRLTGPQLVRWTLVLDAWARGRTTRRSMLTCGGRVIAQATVSATSSALSGSATPS